MTAVNSRNPARSLGERVLRRHLGQATEAAAMARSAGSALALALRIQRKVSRATSLRPSLVTETADNSGRFAGEVEARFPLVQRKFVRRATGATGAPPLSDASAESSPLPQDDAPSIQRSVETSDADEADAQPIRLPSMNDIRERIRRSQAAASSPEAQAPADTEPPAAAEPQPRTMDEVRQRIQRSTAAAASVLGGAPSAPAAPQTPAVDPSPRFIARQARRRATIEEITPSTARSVQREVGEPTSSPRERRTNTAEAAGGADSDEGDAAASAPVIQRTFEASRPAIDLPARTSDERTEVTPTVEATRSHVVVRAPLQTSDATDTVHRAFDDKAPTLASGVREVHNASEPSASRPVVTTPQPSLDTERPLRRQADGTATTHREASGNPPSQVAPLAAQPTNQASTNIQRDVAESAPTLSAPARPVAPLSETTAVVQRMEVPAESLPAEASAHSVEPGSASDVQTETPNRPLADAPQAHGSEPPVQRRVATATDTTTPSGAASRLSEASSVPQATSSPVADAHPSAESIIQRSPEIETDPENEPSQAAIEAQPESRTTVRRLVDQPLTLASDTQKTVPASATTDRVAPTVEGATPVETPRQSTSSTIQRAVLAETGGSAPAATAESAPSESSTSTTSSETGQRSASAVAPTSRSETPVVSQTDELPVTRALEEASLPPAILRQTSDTAGVSTNAPAPVPADQPPPSSRPSAEVAGELSAMSPPSAPSIQRMISQPLPLRASVTRAQLGASPAPISGTESIANEPEPASSASADVIRRLPNTDAGQTPSSEIPEAQRSSDVRRHSDVGTSQTQIHVSPASGSTAAIRRQANTGLPQTPSPVQSASGDVASSTVSSAQPSKPMAQAEAGHADLPAIRAEVPTSSPQIVQRKPISEAPQDATNAPDKHMSAERRNPVSVQPKVPPTSVPDSSIQRATASNEVADSRVEPPTVPPEHRQQAVGVPQAPAQSASDRAPAVQRALVSETANRPLSDAATLRTAPEIAEEASTPAQVRRTISARPAGSVTEAPLPYTLQPVDRIDVFRSPLSVQRTVVPAELAATAPPLPYVPHDAGRASVMPVAVRRDASAPVRRLAAAPHAGDGAGGEPSFAPRQIREVRYAPQAPRVQRAINSDAGVEQGGNLDAMPETLNSVSSPPFEPQGLMDTDRLSMQNLARRVYPFVRALLAAERERRP
ncbi:MAG: hypothetical protein HZB53_17945 [Chloroflexi bacterium]|nr:hypothetical protein [Chloroflexota bacterium]